MQATDEELIAAGRLAPAASPAEKVGPVAAPQAWTTANPYADIIFLFLCFIYTVIYSLSICFLCWKASETSMSADTSKKDVAESSPSNDARKPEDTQPV